MSFSFRGLFYLGVFIFSGCAQRVYVHAPPTPNVNITTSKIAVVSADRSCQSVANAVAEKLTREQYFEVDPKATVKLIMRGCRQSIRPTVEITNHVDARTGTREEQRAVFIQGRSLAEVTIETNHGVQAELIGSASWHEQTDGPKATRNVLTQLKILVADDLVEQVRPIPRIAERRIFPNASPGSHRALLTAAVAAELNGDLERALLHAQAALSRSPSARLRIYIDELERRLAAGN